LSTQTDFGRGESEAVNELSAFFRPAPVDSPACNNGCIAIDAYPEIINDSRRGPDSWIINPGYPLLFIDQNITCPSECVIAGQNSVESLGVPLQPKFAQCRSITGATP